MNSRLIEYEPYRDYWQPRLTSIGLILKSNGVVRDVRRMILRMYLTEEAFDRHENNCVGPEYYRLTHLKPLRSKILPHYPLYKPPFHLLSKIRSSQVILLRPSEADFLKAAYPDVKFTINHPSENLIICSQHLYHRLILCYIHAKKPPPYTNIGDDYFTVDDILENAIGKSAIEELRSNHGRLQRQRDVLERTIIEVEIEGKTVLKILYVALKTIMTKKFLDAPTIRNVTPAMVERLEKIDQQLKDEWKIRIDDRRPLRSQP